MKKMYMLHGVKVTGEGQEKSQIWRATESAIFVTEKKNWRQKMQNEKFFHMNSVFEHCLVCISNYVPTRISNQMSLVISM